MLKTNGCPDPGTWRAYLDDQLSGATRGTCEAHLAACSACAATITALRSQASLVYDALDGIVVPLPQTRRAWQRTQARRRQLAEQTMKWRLQMMWRSLTGARWRLPFATAVAVLALVAIMAIAPLRTAAARLLGIFRVQNLAVIQVDPANIDRLANFQEKIFAEPQVGDAPRRPSIQSTKPANWPVSAS